MAPQNIKIMLWNVQSLYSTGTYGEFQKAVDESNPNIICLVETWLNQEKSLKLKGYQTFRKDRDCRGGGLAILTRLELDAKIIDINTAHNGNERHIYEVLGVSITFNNNPLSIINFYNPHANSVSNELNQVISRIHGKIILCGDFNARHPTWDTYGANPAGADLHNFITTSRNLSLLTPQNLGTRRNVRGNGDSTLDLFISDSSFISHSLITRSVYTGGSDHYPTYLQIKGKPTWNPIKFRGKWKLEPHLWATWVSKIIQENFVSSGDLEKDLATLTEKIIESNREIFKRSTGTYTTKYYAPWWNDECTIARINRRRAKRRLQRYYSVQNHANYKKAIAIAKRTIKKTKKEY